MNIRPQALSRNHFAFSPAIAFFLHSARNFLRALPCNPLASASLEHSRDSAVRGLAIFGAWVAPSLLVAGAVAVWANAGPAIRREATAAVAKSEESLMGAPVEME